MALLTDLEIEHALEHLPGWNQEGHAIVRHYSFESFLKAIEFIKAIAPHAEHANHHPEIYNVYNKVTITLNTHDEGGITEKDTTMASEIEQVASSMMMS